ncbi:MAG: hypothetical protein AABW79_02500 [Nanoarchaeota archaeon]
MVSRKQIIIGVIALVFALLFYSYFTTPEIFYSPRSTSGLSANSGSALVSCDKPGKCVSAVSTLELADELDSVARAGDFDFPWDNPLHWTAKCLRDLDSDLAFCDEIFEQFHNSGSQDFCVTGAKNAFSHCIRLIIS